MSLPNVAGQTEPRARSAGSDADVARDRAILLKLSEGRGDTREQTRRRSRPAFRRDAKSRRPTSAVKVEADDVAARERSREQAVRFPSRDFRTVMAYRSPSYTPSP